MTYKVAAFYQLLALPEFRELQQPLRSILTSLGLKGTVLLAHEGINGTIAGTADGIDAFVDQLRTGSLFSGRLDRLELKFSASEFMPFQRLKVRLKKEVVTLGDRASEETSRVGVHVEPADWNDLVTTPGTVLIDTRNGFEVKMGTFEGAIDPQLRSFGQFKEFADRALDSSVHRTIAMFCTGGIRCEKASAYLLSRGFEQVYQLKGGILNYLETVPQSRSRWRGECFVFDERVALGHGLVPRVRHGEQHE